MTNQPQRDAREILNDIWSQRTPETPEERAIRIERHRGKPRLTLAVRYDQERGALELVDSVSGPDGIQMGRYYRDNPELASFSIQIGLDPDDRNHLYADIHAVTDPALIGSL